MLSLGKRLQNHNGQLLELAVKQGEEMERIMRVSDMGGKSYTQFEYWLQ